MQNWIKKLRLLKDSEMGLEAIREYLSNLIENKEKKSVQNPANLLKYMRQKKITIV